MESKSSCTPSHYLRPLLAVESAPVRCERCPRIMRRRSRRLQSAIWFAAMLNSKYSRRCVLALSVRRWIQKKHHSSRLLCNARGVAKASPHHAHKARSGSRRCQTVSKFLVVDAFSRSMIGPNKLQSVLFVARADSSATEYVYRRRFQRTNSAVISAKNSKKGSSDNNSSFPCMPLYGLTTRVHPQRLLSNLALSNLFGEDGLEFTRNPSGLCPAQCYCC